MGTEKKYRIIAEVQRKGHSVNFDVLYYAQSHCYADIIAEIGEKEGEFNRKYNPILNTQIPKDDDWHKFDIKKLDAKSILSDLL